MASSFIAFEVVNATEGYENGEVLINKQNIIGVTQLSQGNVTILTTGGAPGDQIGVSLSTTASGAIVLPSMATGLGTKAFNYALTANPGGVKAKVFLGKDDAGDQIYIRNVAFT